MIGMDYERGLAMLKDYIEDGKVHSDLAFHGQSDFPGCTYVGIRTSTTMEQVGPAMEADFTKLEAFAKEQGEILAGKPFSIYHKFDMVKQQIEYTAGIPIKETPQNLADGLMIGSIPATKVNTVEHTGPYGHLGNAWSAQYSMKQNKKFKLNKGIDPFEVYENDPAETDAKELVTAIHFPVK